MLVQLDFYSKTLCMDQSLYVTLPDEKSSTTAMSLGFRGELKEKLPVLFLLHGAGGDFTWWRNLPIERLANEKGIATVSMTAQLSSYCNQVYGEDFLDYVSLEVPETVRRFFPISDKREDNFIAGISMGGYGATKIGLLYPERFAAIGSLSNGNHAWKRVIDTLANRADAMPSKIINERHLFNYGCGEGETPVGTEIDLYYLAQRNIDNGIRPLPAIFHLCGTDDRNLVQARHMRDFFRGLEGDPYRYIYFEEPYTNHYFDAWERWIAIFFNWLPVDLNG